MSIRTVINSTLRRLNVIGANETPSDADAQICLEALDALIDSMSTNRLNIHTITPQRFLLTPDKQKYLLGPATYNGVATSADWVTPRPIRIEDAVLMLYPSVNGTTIGATSGTVFVPLERANYSKFADITARSIHSTWPTLVYDNNAFPARELTFWPVPQNAYGVELWMWAPLLDYTTLDDALNLPPGYERYITLKLALEVAPEFGKQVSDVLKTQCREAESAVQTLNQELTKQKLSQAGKRLTGHGSTWMDGDVQPFSTPRQF